MLELLMQGVPTSDVQRMLLLPGKTYAIGRDATSNISVPWERLLSRRHAHLNVYPDHVQIHRLSSARNPLFFSGESVESCRVEIGQHFVIGTTSFSLLEIESADSAVVPNNLKEKESQLIKLAYNSVRKRVAEALSTLSRKYKKEDEKEFAIHISREDLANLAGTATETTIRTLSDFKEEGIISIEKGFIIVLDNDALVGMRN